MVECNASARICPVHSYCDSTCEHSIRKQALQAVLRRTASGSPEVGHFNGEVHYSAKQTDQLPAIVVMNEGIVGDAN